MHSCLYLGRTSHIRRTPVEHRFGYSLYMMYLDLDELDHVVGSVAGLSKRRFALASFQRQDHFGDPTQSLADSVRDLVAEQTGNRPDGPIRLLTQLRCLGTYFSPINLFYCFAADGSSVESIVAEVSNTPWFERHCYVLSDMNRVDSTTTAMRHRHDKAFHVSPFMGMDAEYDWRLGVPGDHLSVLIRSRRNAQQFFAAQLTLKRTELTNRTMLTTLLRYPWITASVNLGIYYQALRLWMKQCPPFPHPKKLPTIPNNRPLLSEQVPAK